VSTIGRNIVKCCRWRATCTCIFEWVRDRDRGLGVTTWRRDAVGGGVTHLIQDVSVSQMLCLDEEMRVECACVCEREREEEESIIEEE